VEGEQRWSVLSPRLLRKFVGLPLSGTVKLPAGSHFDVGGRDPRSQGEGGSTAGSEGGAKDGKVFAAESKCSDLIS